MNIVNGKKKMIVRVGKLKYYKGLGTSTAKEFKEYFKERKIVNFEYNGKN